MSLAPQSLGPTFPLSVVNALGSPLRRQLVRIDAEVAMRWAERLTGLHDYGDSDGAFRQRVDDTIDSLLRVDWNIIGRFAVRYILNWHLSNRLRVVETLKQNSLVEEIALERPLVITGLFRTGTTFLHNVMAADPRSRAGRTWELSYPVGRAPDLMDDQNWRRRRTARAVAMDNMLVPDQGEVHAISVDAYEEDFFLLENDFANMKFFVGLGDFAYGRQMLDWDMVEPYRWHKRQLQILWAQRSSERWLLKCPWHLWNLQALLAVYPDARVIQTHRGLLDVIGSQCSLSSRIAGKFQRNLDLHDVGRFWLDYSRIGIERGLEARTALPASQVYDVRLADLRSKPLDTIEDLYAHFGLPFDGNLAALLSARIADEPTAQFGEHDYHFADYGLTEDQIQSTFSDYRQRVGV